MNQFASLESQVLKAQRAVDVLGLAHWAESLLVAVESQGLLHSNPKLDVTRREIVAMPDDWLKELSAYPEASEMGIAYLGRYAQRHGFVSIHAASRWLDIERSAQIHPANRYAPYQHLSDKGGETGLKQLLTRAALGQLEDEGTFMGFAKELISRSSFEFTEALDLWRRSERRRHK
jgi:hypothetical protein